MKCAYCRQQIVGKWAWEETRPYVLIKLDGTRIEGVHSFLVCDPCHVRLPVDRA